MQIQQQSLLQTLQPTLDEFQKRFESIQRFIDKSNEMLPKIRQKVQNKQQSNSQLLTDKIMQSCSSIKSQIQENITETKNAQTLLQKFKQAMQSNPVENAKQAVLQIDKLEKDSVVLIENLEVVTDLINNILFVINNKSGVKSQIKEVIQTQPQQVQQPQQKIEQQQTQQIQQQQLQQQQQDQLNNSIINKYESIIEQLSKENTQLQEKLNQQQVELVQLRTAQSQTNALSQSRIELNQELQTLSLQLQKEVEQNKKYNQQINSLAQELSIAKQEQEEKISDLQNANNNYRAQLQHVSQEIEESIQQITELSTQNQKLNADVVQLNKDCQMYQQQINELQQVIEKQNEQLRDLKQLQFEQRIQQQTNTFNNQLIQQVQPQQMQQYQQQIPTLYNSRATFSYKPEQLNLYQQTQSQQKQQSQNMSNQDMKELLKSMNELFFLFKYHKKIHKQLKNIQMNILKNYQKKKKKEIFDLYMEKFKQLQDTDIIQDPLSPSPQLDYQPIYQQYYELQDYKQKVKFVDELIENESYKDLVNIFNYLSNNYHKSCKQLFDILPRAVCGKFGYGKCAYRCLTCSNDINSIFCKECFDFEKHKDHEYITLEFSGQCDCGDIAAIQHCWCNKHYGNNTIRTIEYYKEQGFDIEFCYIFISLCMQKVLNCLLRKDEKGNTTCDLLYKILYQIIFNDHPVDFYRYCIVNSLFNTIEKQNNEFPKDFMNPQFELPYIDTQIILNDIRNGIIKENIPLIVYFSHISMCFVNQYVYFIENVLAKNIISTTIYRQGLCHYMPQIFDSILHTILVFKQQIESPWIQSICQLYCSIRVYEYQSLVQQWAQYYWIQYYVDKLLSKMDQQLFYQYKLPKDIINTLQSTDYKKYQSQYCDSLVKHYQQEYQQFDYYVYQFKNMISYEIQQAWSIDFQIQTDLYGNESINHLSNVGNNEQALMITLLGKFRFSQFMIYFRTKVIEFQRYYDEKVQQAAQNKEQAFLYGLFISSLVGQEYTQKEYYLRAHQNFTREQIDKSITKDNIRKICAKLSIKLILLQVDKIKQCLEENGTEDSPLIIYDIYVLLLSYMLISQTIVNGKPEQLIDICLKEIVKEKLEAGYNITTQDVVNNLIYMLVNNLITNSLYQAKQFSYYPHVGFNQIYNEQGSGEKINQQTQSLYYIFYILKVLYDNGYQKEVLEGLTKQFQVYSNIYPERKSKLYMQIIICISILEFSQNLKLFDIQQYKENITLEIMLQYHNNQLYIIEDALSVHHWYQKYTQKEFVRSYMQQIKQTQYKKIYYDTSVLPKLFQLKQDKIELIKWLNPIYCLKTDFCTQFKQVSQNYKKNAFSEINKSFSQNGLETIQYLLNEIQQTQQYSLFTEYDYLLLNKLSQFNQLQIQETLQKNIDLLCENQIQKNPTSNLLREKVNKLKQKNMSIYNTQLQEDEQILKQSDNQKQNNISLNIHECCVCGYIKKEQVLLQVYSSQIIGNQMEKMFYSCYHFIDLQCYKQTVFCPLCKCFIYGVQPYRVDIECIKQIQPREQRLKPRVWIKDSQAFQSYVNELYQVINISQYYDEDRYFLINRIRDFIFCVSGNLIKQFIHTIYKYDEYTIENINQYVQNTIVQDELQEEYKKIYNYVLQIINLIVYRKDDIIQKCQQNNLINEKEIEQINQDQICYLQQTLLEKTLQEQSESILEAPLLNIEYRQFFDLNKYFKQRYQEVVEDMIINKCYIENCKGYQKNTQNFICLICGKRFCSGCYLDHMFKGCQPQVMLHVNKNVLLIGIPGNNEEYVCIEGAPYLDIYDQNDIQRFNRVELYRNDYLLKNLWRLITWKFNHYFFVESRILHLQGIDDILQKWSKEDNFV